MNRFPPKGLGLLNRPRYVIRHRVEKRPTVDLYDILDPDTRQLLGQAREKTPRRWARFVRFAFGRNLLPTTLHVRETGQTAPLFSILELSSVWQARLRVVDGAGQMLGYFRCQFAVMGGAFSIFDAHGRHVAEFQGDLNGWNYAFVTRDGRQVGAVQCEPSAPDQEGDGLGSDYTITLNPPPACGTVASVLLLSATLALDIVYRERV